MARRSYSGTISDPRLIIVAIIIAGFAWVVSVALTSAMYGPPLILLCGLLYNEFREHQRHTLLTSDETRSLSAFEAELRGISHRLGEIKEEGSRLNLKRNIDGSYYRGSRRGPELNNEREKLWDRESKIVPYTRYLRGKPLVSLDRWIHIESLRRAFRLTIVAYIAIFASLYILEPASLEGLSFYVWQHTLAHISGVNFAFYGDAIVTGISSAFLLLPSYAAWRISLRDGTNEERKRLEEFAQEGETEPPEESDEEFADEEDEQRDENGAGHEEDQPRRGSGAGDRERQKRREDERDDWRDVGSGAMSYAQAYEVLGLTPGATEQEIRAAYNGLMKRVHPDVGGSEFFSKQLNVARDTLLV